MSYPKQMANSTQNPSQSQPGTSIREFVVVPIEADEWQNPFVLTQVRNAFIRKVFQILTIQLLFTFLGVLYVFLTPELQAWLYQHMELLYVSAVLIFVICIAFLCFPLTLRAGPVCFTCVVLVTIFYTIILSYICARVPSETVLTAVVITLTVTIAITLFACQTKFDFTAYMGVIMLLSIALLGFAIAYFFVPTKTMNLIYCIFGVIVVGLYLIIDIQMILIGKHKHSYEPDMYAFAALSLYIDIIQLFLYILRILVVKE